MKNPAELHLEVLQKMLSKLIKDNNITFVTATQPAKLHLHHVKTLRFPHDGPDIVIIDYMNKFR